MSKQFKLSVDALLVLAAAAVTWHNFAIKNEIACFASIVAVISTSTHLVRNAFFEKANDKEDPS